MQGRIKHDRMPLGSVDPRPDFLAAHRLYPGQAEPLIWLCWHHHKVMDACARGPGQETCWVQNRAAAYHYARRAAALPMPNVGATPCAKRSLACRLSILGAGPMLGVSVQVGLQCMMALPGLQIALSANQRVNVTAAACKSLFNQSQASPGPELTLHRKHETLKGAMCARAGGPVHQWAGVRPPVPGRPGGARLLHRQAPDHLQNARLQVRHVCAGVLPQPHALCTVNL